MKRTVMDMWHPVVQVTYFSVVICLGMLAFQPALVGLSLACGLAYGLFLRGPEDVGRSLVWQLPLVALVCVVNPLYSASGSTIVFTFGSSKVYLESLAYGATLGMLLVSTVTWFANAGAVLTTSKIMAFFSNVAPTVALMLSMVARLVPELVARGYEIDAVQDACSSRREGGVLARLRSRSRLVTVLVGWALEDSFETADAMRARGWGARRRRTTYRRERFRARDAAMLACLLALAAACAALAWVATTQFSFYPKLTPLVPWWGYVPLAALYLSPLALELLDHLRWM